MNPSNDHPEIPALKPVDKKEEDKKGGGPLPSSKGGSVPAPAGKPSEPGGSGFKFPSFGSKGSMPNLRVRGLPGGSTVMDRLKNLRKKDLIFIAAGLCTLGMAPLAEHLLMAPEEQAGVLKEGFSTQGPLFPDGTTVYESGSGVGSPGNLPGQGSDVITPLNVRDPSNLVMSPGAQKKPDAVVSAPPPPVTPGKGEADWKDVLRDSAKNGVTKGIQKAAKLPMPNSKMAGAIRGLSALGGGGGGTGASLKLDPLTAQHAPNHAAESGALTRSQATPGFRGATSRGMATGSGEALKGAAMNQADIFNRGGGAANALDAASKEAIPNGGAGSGGGRPGTGDDTKSPGNNSQKDNKALGESLDFLRRKMEMEKQIDLKWKKAEWKQFGRQKMIEESAIKMGFDMFGKLAEKAVINPLGDFIAQAVTPGAAQYFKCTLNNGQPGPSGTKAQIGGQGYQLIGNTLWGKDGNNQLGTCTVVAQGDTGGAPDPTRDPNAPGGIQGPPRTNRASRVQQQVDGLVTQYCSSPGGGGGQMDAARCQQLTAIQTISKNDLGFIHQKNVEAQDFIRQGYAEMKTNTVPLLDRAQASLGSTLGVAAANAPAGGAAAADAPVSKMLAKGNEAKTKLEGGKNTDAETLLGAGKTEGLDRAIGAQQGQANCGGTLTDACNTKGTAAQSAQAAKTSLDQAAQMIVAGHERAVKVKADLERIQAAAGAAPTGGAQPTQSDAINGRVVSDAAGQVLTALGPMVEDLKKTGGTNGTDGGLNKTALAVYRDNIAASRSAIHGLAPAQPGQAPAQGPNNDALTLTLAAVDKGKSVVTLPTATTTGSDMTGGGETAVWKKAADADVIAGAAAAQPAQTPEQFAARQNGVTLAPLLQPLEPAITAARNRATAAGTSLGQAKTKLDACIQAYQAGNPDC